MPCDDWPAETIGMCDVGRGSIRQSSIWKYSPWKSLRPVSHSSFITCMYSVW